MELMVQRPEEGGFDPKGLRSFFEYRDLGIAGATGGRFHAQVIRAREACSDGTGRHRHTLDFQFVYVLKGWVDFWYDGMGEVRLAAGACAHQPPGIAHELLRCSEDCEILELTAPAAFETHDVTE